MRVAEVLDEFLKHLALERNYTPHTLEAYARHLNHVIAPMAGSPRELSADKVRAAMARYIRPEHSLSFRAQCVSALKHFLKYLYRAGITPQNEAQFLDIPFQPQRLPHIITEEQIFALLESPDVTKPRGLRDRALLETLYGTGIRVSEAVGLTVSDIAYGEGTVRVMGKRSKERVIPLADRTLFWLKQYQDEVRMPLWAQAKELPYVFLSTGGRHLSRVHAWRIIVKYARAAGISECTPHTLRHAFASHLVQRGADLRSVQSLLGHQSLRATQIYTRVGPKHLEDLISEYHLLSAAKKTSKY